MPLDLSIATCRVDAVNTHVFQIDRNLLGCFHYIFTIALNQCFLTPLGVVGSSSLGPEGQRPAGPRTVFPIHFQLRRSK